MSYSPPYHTYRPIHPATNGYANTHRDNGNDYDEYNNNDSINNDYSSHNTRPSNTLHHRNVRPNNTLQRQTSTHTPLTRVIRTVRSADIFYKADNDYILQHHAGGLISIIAFSIITLLMLNECYQYIYPPPHTHISVETRKNMKDYMSISYNFTFPALPCKDIGIDVLDISGESHADVDAVLGASSSKNTANNQAKTKQHGASLVGGREAWHVKLAADGGWMTAPYESEYEHQHGNAQASHGQGHAHAHVDANTNTQQQQQTQSSNEAASQLLQELVKNFDTSNKNTQQADNTNNDDANNNANANANKQQNEATNTAGEGSSNNANIAHNTHARRLLAQQHTPMLVPANAGTNDVDTYYQQHLSLLKQQNAAQLSVHGTGCLLWGSIKVNKVAGNMHIALGGAHNHAHYDAEGNPVKPQHVHQFASPLDVLLFNASHTINYLRFGDEIPIESLSSTQHTKQNPLNGATQRIDKYAGVFQYFIKIIPTVYSTDSEEIDSNQYSVTNYTIQLTPYDLQRITVNRLPGLYFLYDLSPFVIYITQKSPRLSELLTTMCAIIGGIITIASIIDSLIYHMNTKRKIKDRIKG